MRVYNITSDKVSRVTKEDPRMMNTQLYELAQIREQEYMLAATTRRGGYRRGNRLVAGVTRRLRRRSGDSQA